LADCYAQQGNYSAGVDCYQEALHCDPHNGQFHFCLGSLHFKHHRFNEAIAAYRKAEKLDYRRDKCRLYILEARAKLVMGVK
jgi:cytochrome c-type biogenesis protein CcmH/NrfG